MAQAYSTDSATRQVDNPLPHSYAEVFLTSIMCSRRFLQCDRFVMGSFVLLLFRWIVVILTSPMAVFIWMEKYRGY